MSQRTQVKSHATNSTGATSKQGSTVRSYLLSLLTFTPHPKHCINKIIIEKRHSANLQRKIPPHSGNHFHTNLFLCLLLSLRFSGRIKGLSRALIKIQHRWKFSPLEVHITRLHTQNQKQFKNSDFHVNT